MDNWNELILEARKAKAKKKKKPAKKAKKKEWKTGTKLGIKGTVKAALDHHPDKFGKGPGKLNPYAIFTAKAKKGMTPHYKNQASTLEGTPKKKKKFEEWLKLREEAKPGDVEKVKQKEKDKKWVNFRLKSMDLKQVSKKEQEAANGKA